MHLTLSKLEPAKPMWVSSYLFTGGYPKKSGDWSEGKWFEWCFLHLQLGFPAKRCKGSRFLTNLVTCYSFHRLRFGAFQNPSIGSHALYSLSRRRERRRRDGDLMKFCGWSCFFPEIIPQIQTRFTNKTETLAKIGRFNFVFGYHCERRWYEISKFQCWLFNDLGTCC